MAADAGALEIRPLDSHKLEIFLAIAIGIAAIGTAYAAYSASLLGDDMISNYQIGIRKVDEASQAYNEANTYFAQDQAVFLEFIKATQTGDTDLAKYIQTTLMSPELSTAVDAWAEGTELTPFVGDSTYSLEQVDQGTALDSAADRRFAAAADADEESDRYELVTVIMAAVLFFLGMAAVIQRSIARRGFIVAGVALLAVSLVMLGILTV